MGARVLTGSETKSWADAQEALLRAKATNAIAAGQPTFWTGIVTLFDRMAFNADGDKVRIDYRAWELLDLVRDMYAPSGPDRGEDIYLQPHLFLESMRDLARIRRARYAIQNGTVALLDNVPEDIQPSDRLGPPYLATYRKHAWKDMPYLGFGRVGSGLIERFPHHADALHAEQVDATIGLTASKKFGLDIRLTDILVEAQLFNLHAPGIAKAIQRLKPHEAEALQRIMLALADRGQGRGLVEGEGAVAITPQELVQAFQDQGAYALLERFVASNAKCEIAAFIPWNNVSLYSPALLRGIGVLARLKLKFPDEKKMFDAAATTFVRLVSRLMQAKGFTTQFDGHELIECKIEKTKKADPNEVDVVCWNSDTFWLIEVKAEAQHPTEQAPDKWEARRRELEDEYQRKLLAKTAKWRDLLAKGDRKLNTPSGVVTLPADLLATRRLCAAIVSMRIEPKPTNDQPPVVSFLPEAAARVALQIFPHDEVAPIWNGTDDLPEPSS